MWDFESGKHLFEFGNAHGGSAVTCLTFDPSGRRYGSKYALGKGLPTLYTCCFFHGYAGRIMVHFNYILD